MSFWTSQYEEPEVNLFWTTNTESESTHPFLQFKLKISGIDESQYNSFWWSYLENAGTTGKDIVVVGKTPADKYSESDITDPSGSGVDLSTLISLEDVNDHNRDQLLVYDRLEGNTNRLFAYGICDFKFMFANIIFTVYIDHK